MAICRPVPPNPLDTLVSTIQAMRLVHVLLTASAGALFAGCASAPGVDGPPENPPPGIERTPDAVPRLEPIRVGGPNKPYSVAGRTYVPLAGDVAFSESGLASWYGRKFHGRPTSSGEPYDMFAMTAAHKTLPIPSYARVRNPANGREIVVRINDRGPFADGRVIDLSYAAAAKLGLLAAVAPVTVRRITFADMRAADLLGLADARPSAQPAPHP
jgi:rare lipoprotein A